MGNSSACSWRVCPQVKRQGRSVHLKQMCACGHVGRCVFLHLHPQAEAGRTQLSSDILCIGMEAACTAEHGW